MKSSAPFPAVFFDRDDTLVHCSDLPPPPPPAKPGDLVHPQLVRLLPGALEACTALRDAGFRLVVFTNQGVVARGGAPLSLVESVHDRMRAKLTAAGEHCSLIEATYYCPYHPEGLVARFTREDEWRKPKPGMIRTATAELGLDLSRSWVVGDAGRDIEAGVGAGMPPGRCLLVRPGTAIPNLAAAARVILSNPTP